MDRCAVHAGEIFSPEIPFFDATITLRVPSQLTSRTPGLFEALKLAFVQYIAMLIPIGALLTCLHGALFRTGVLAARMHHPIKQHHF